MRCCLGGGRGTWPNNTAEQSSTDLTSTHRQPAPPGEEWGVGRARVEGHIAIYESVKVILVVGVALSLSFSSPLQPLASHSFVARRSSRPLSSSPSSRSLPPPPLLLLRTLLLRTSLVARRGRRRPRRVRGIASRSRAASLALIIDNIDSVCAHHHHSSTVDRRCGCRRAGLLRAPEELLCRPLSACARDCFALPSSFAGAHH